MLLLVFCLSTAFNLMALIFDGGEMAVVVAVLVLPFFDDEEEEASAFPGIFSTAFAFDCGCQFFTNFYMLMSILLDAIYHR